MYRYRHRCKCKRGRKYQVLLHDATAPTRNSPSCHTTETPAWLGWAQGTSPIGRPCLATETACDTISTSCTHLRPSPPPGQHRASHLGQLASGLHVARGVVGAGAGAASWTLLLAPKRRLPSPCWQARRSCSASMPAIPRAPLAAIATASSLWSCCLTVPLLV